MSRLPHFRSSPGSHAVHVAHASRTAFRGKRVGWAVADDTLGRLHPNRFIGRRRAIRLFQHFVKGI